MSRGIKDLRELICVSRLSYRDSEDEILSDALSEGIDSLSLSSGGRSSCESTEGSRSSLALESPDDQCPQPSPDSGCVASNGSPPKNTATSEVTSKRPRTKKKKKKKNHESLQTKHDFPSLTPLPPVSSNESIDSLHKMSPMKIDKETDTPVSVQKVNKSRPHQVTHFDDMLAYMDATVVSSWLTRANNGVSILSSFVINADNFVHFAHFWLSDFPTVQKKEIFELEYEILNEEIGFAFAVGQDQRKISHTDITNLCKAIFHEYPTKILSGMGAHLFLEYLCILSSGRTNEYKKMLSDVKCSTQNRQYAQWILATRSFALVNIWSAIINFYCNCNKKRNVLEEDVTGNENQMDIFEIQLCQAVRLGFTDVVHFFIVCRHVRPDFLDVHGRSLVFIAVMQGQAETLQYLLTMITPALDVNQPSDTGNTPLHAAANNGSLKLVDLLCRCSKININCTNPQCENATPLHLAVMHGHQKVAELLVESGADVDAKMGDLTAKDIATDFGHDEILSIFNKRK